MTINGVAIDMPAGANISIVNGIVTIGGRKATTYSQSGSVVVNITGDVGNLTADGDATVTGNANDVSAGGSVTCGSVAGDVTAGGSVRAAGRLGGSISAGGSVRIG
ncbi:hypothetical protein FRUB_10297 [Fimbriiglobus ruber]|uniref:Uncharacterized protein n=2 Tax=Fimbriiglobus ruber TaxID=1908690 RepID=A0A225DAK4_9BACT|nr:hypothetical protein FRUB_10297 [Fimbriiglobus ruber]